MGGVNQLLSLVGLAAAIASGLKIKDYISEARDERWGFCYQLVTIAFFLGIGICLNPIVSGYGCTGATSSSRKKYCDDTTRM